MKNGLAAILLVLSMTSSVLAAGNGPEIKLTDHKLSINAESIPLGRLLRLLDLATGMQSKVPPELANRSLSVRFSGLSLEDGVRKIFQGQPFDYVVLEGQGVIVTSAAQTSAGTEASSPPVYTPSQQQPFAPQPIEQPFVPDFQPPVQPGFQPGQPVQPGQQPAMIQTPFGPIANPRAGQPAQPFAPAPAPALQQNPLFPDQRQNQQQPTQGLPGAMPAAPAPFGTPSPFGSPQISPNNSNGPFGAPTVFSAPGGTQTRP